MTLSGRDEADTAVTMLRVVPGNEALHPGAGLIDIAEALPRVGRCVLQRPEQSLGVWVVVRDRRATKGW